MIPDDILTFLWGVFKSNPEVLNKLKSDNPSLGNLSTKIQIKNKLLKKYILWESINLIKDYIPGKSIWDKIGRWQKMFDEKNFDAMRDLIPEQPVTVKQDGQTFMI